MITSVILSVALILGMTCLWTARRLALAVGLVDRPDARKRHFGEVPLAGGAGIYATLLVTILLTWPLAPVGDDGIAAASLGLLALALGMVDDARGLPPKLRLLLQLGIALLLVWTFDIHIDTLGNVLGTGVIDFGPVAATVFTAFCVAGAMNATNMTDGLDGLLASLVAMSLVTLVVMTLMQGNDLEPLCIIVIGALTAFLWFNLGLFGERRRLFLGDSGSNLLGLLLAVLLIGASQGPNSSIEPVTAGWLLGLPLLDTMVVVVRRLIERRSPFVAGRDHLHHLLQDRGLLPRQALGVMILLHYAMLSVGFASEARLAPAWVFLYGFAAVAVVHLAVSAYLAHRSAGADTFAPASAGPAPPEPARPQGGASSPTTADHGATSPGTASGRAPHAGGTGGRAPRTLSAGKRTETVN